MRIAIIGQSAFGESVLQALVNKDENIVGVFCPPDSENKPQDPIKLNAQANKIPVFQFSRMRDSECIETFESLSSDLCIMAYVVDIVPDQILNAPTKGTIQYHPSILPKHRGPSSINWAIIQGDKQTGFTIFWPDGDLDTGPILYQEVIDIGPNDSTGSLYFKKLYPRGVRALIECVDMVRNDVAPRIPQDHSKATYEGWCRSKDVFIDWHKPINLIHDLIRGSDPSPGSRTYFKDVELCVYGSSIVSTVTDGSPGEVMQVTEEGMLIACNDGLIKIKKLKPLGGVKSTALELAEKLGIGPGSSLNNTK
ncbi:MAG: methionyl-tRNA formyltransferase [Dehalococcoidia bacterium]|nr:methionyl-tRNA formyltransferase [Dehalococcoidia bacterium]MQG15935.1 methionyl-tRNA formyltransferase [SAR202 cluster bacterium]